MLPAGLWVKLHTLFRLVILKQHSCSVPCSLATKAGVGALPGSRAQLWHHLSYGKRLLSRCYQAFVIGSVC